MSRKNRHRLIVAIIVILTGVAIYAESIGVERSTAFPLILAISFITTIIIDPNGGHPHEADPEA